MRDFILWGARGHAKVLAEIIVSAGDRVVAVFDNDHAATSPLAGVPIYYGVAGLAEWTAGRSDIAGVAALAAIGGSRGADRLAFFQIFRSNGFMSATLIHSTAWMAADARLGDGCQILARATIGADVEIGDAVIVNTAASVDHECRLDSGVHIGPGATLCGCVSVGRNSFVGAGAVLLPRITIGENVIIGAGSVVTRDVPAGKIAAGNPARLMKDAR